jgi:hypothetical protein
MPPDKSREGMVLHAIKEIIDLLQLSIRNWKRETDLEEKHPELTSFVTFHIAEWFRVQTVGLAHQLFRSQKNTLMIFIDNQVKQEFLNRRLTMGREECQQKQEQRGEK